jgi:phosphohistidine swiveling domain-containing protein
LPDASPLTLTFAELSTDDLPRVGGKGANLGALTRAGVSVPPGFCVTTRAFDRFIAALPHPEARFAALEALDGTSAEAARAAAEAMRSALDALAMPEDVARAIVTAWRALGPEHALAVRSSATAEDLPGASFAGQQDTYLNVQGEPALLDAVRRCWISLFTDRAVLYRARGRFGHRSVQLAVVVQTLIDPDVSGILFTADPITGNRYIASIDAGFGLGEALVSGLISADLYRVDMRSREVLLARPGSKAFAIRSVPGGGTRREALPESQREARALSDEQVRALAEVGARVQSFYGGAPQDVEWCIARGAIYVVQTRPITSLFPVPATPRADRGLRVFLSFGHLQMMVDAMPRLAQQVWQLFLPAGKEGITLRSPPTLCAVMVPAGGRLYIDVTGLLRLRRLRGALLGLLSHAYAALGQSIAALVDRPAFREGRGATGAVLWGVLRALGPLFARVPGALLFQDPAAGAAGFDRALEVLPRQSGDRVRAAGTPAGRIRQCTVELNALFSRVRRHLPRMLAGFIALALVRRLAQGRWADSVRGDVEVLVRGLPGNVTTQMDLAAGDLTEVLRPHPDLATMLRTHAWREARELLPKVDGGSELSVALERFLARYGNRGASEIDLSRPRWHDDPSLLLRVMMGGLSAEAAGGHRRQHQAQVAAGEASAARLVAAAADGFWGPLRKRWVHRLVRVARIGMGLREHPKFVLVQVLGIVRAEALAAGKSLVQRGQLADAQDVWHLGFDELAAALDDPTVELRERVAARTAELRRDQARKPPIAISSEGEIPTVGGERADLPPGALAGTAASAGVVEGIARVVTDPGREILQAGEILVAPFTDPGWTPLFVHAAGLVTEVGGMMTHGAVVAREYGIPAVVSVALAVERIKTGQRIRVNGTRGFVQILEDT